MDICQCSSLKETWEKAVFEKHTPVPKGKQTNRKKEAESAEGLCWQCGRPVGDCPWLLDLIPFEGSRISRKRAPANSKAVPFIYRMEFCPMWVEWEE